MKNQIIFYSFLAFLLIVNCEELFDESENSINKTEAPSYIGKYDGSVDIEEFETGKLWNDKPAVMSVSYNSSEELVEVEANFYGRDLPNERIRIKVEKCSAKTSSISCEEQGGNTLYEINISFSKSSASATFQKYRQQSNGDYILLIKAEGTFQKE